MTTLAHTLRLSLATAVSVAVVASVATLRADTVALVSTAAVAPKARTDVASTSAPYAREQLVAALTRAIGAHFNFEGELQIELLRAWTPPAKVATVWELNVQDFPAMPSASMMVRCQLVGDAAPV